MDYSKQVVHIMAQQPVNFKPVDKDLIANLHASNPPDDQPEIHHSPTNDYNPFDSQRTNDNDTTQNSNPGYLPSAGETTPQINPGGTSSFYSDDENNPNT